jgi:pimeloyl-ACP methyl ester carboxylesterase
MTTDYLLEESHVRGVPVLSIAVKGAERGFPVIVLHGLGSRKERVLRSAFEFARAGFHTVAFDLRSHGGRPDADQRERALSESYSETISRIINGSVADLSCILDDLGIEQCAVHGISLGGIIACLALCGEPRLKIATIAMGSPDWLNLFLASGNGPDHPAYELVCRNSPLNFAPASYPPRPVLFLHGELDTTVPVEGVRNAIQALEPAYAAFPERFHAIIYPGVAHVYTEEMLHESVAWTRRFAGE